MKSSSKRAVYLSLALVVAVILGACSGQRMGNGTGTTSGSGSISLQGSGFDLCQADHG